MPIQRLPLLDLEGLDDEEAYLVGRKAFADILLSAPVWDPLKRRILFRFGHPDEPIQAEFCQPLNPPRRDAFGRLKDDCWHVCFVEAHKNKNKFCDIPRDRFDRTRVARIPWILTALTDPDTRIHESPTPQERNRQSYSLWLPGDPKTNIPTEFFATIVREPTGDSAEFVTGYPLDDQKALERLRALGPQIHPAKSRKRKAAGRK